jgi:hypothetical protein
MNSETMWQTKLREIRECGGFTFRAIKDELGCSLGAVNDLASGRTHDAAYALGVKIIALHKRATRRRPQLVRRRIST